MPSPGGTGGPSNMDHEPQLVHHDHQAFTDDQWGEMGSYMQTSMADYNNAAYAFMTPTISHGLPSESLARMPPPAPPSQPVLRPHPHPHQHSHSHQQAQAHTHPHHSSLPILMIPSNPTWPSMLTNPGGFNTSPPVAIPPVSAGVVPLKPSRPPLSQLASQPRKTLTDDDRRRMCQYHLDNPSMKQTEIGALFGVERSTVSKVLSRKDKWLNPEERSNSPVKKAKGKIPDIDKTLANWLRNEQRKGRNASDTEILEQARLYARPFREAETKINSPLWLDKFKQRHNFVGRLLRRASETNLPNSTMSNLSTASPTMDSPQPSSATSPIEQQTLSPLASARMNGSKEDKKEGSSSSSLLLNFNDPPSGGSGGDFKHPVFSSDTGGTPLSEANLSPTGTGQFTFSPDPNVGGFLSSDQARQFGPGGPNFQRPRSQTFPTLDLEFMNQTESNPPNEPATPKFPPEHISIPCTVPSPALGSPAHEFAPPGGPFGLDSAMSPRHQRSRRGLRHSSSASSLSGRGGQHQQAGGSTTPIIGSTTLSPVASSPTSPSQEDAQRAANTLLSFIANSGPNSLIDQTDYNAVIRLTEKLMLHQQAQQAQQAAARNQANMSMGPPVLSGLGVNLGMGGLDRIPEGDAEMGDTGHQTESQGEMIKSEEPMAV